MLQANVNASAQVRTENVTRVIYILRGQKVLLDADLAALYGVPTKRFNEQVKRNLSRFPIEFMFQLSNQEFSNLRSQFATSSWGGRRKLPYAFTEHGAIMAASILNTPRAIDVSVYVVRAFLQLREVLATHKELAKRLDELESSPVPRAAAILADKAVTGSPRPRAAATIGGL